jgi:hypothetical protein
MQVKFLEETVYQGKKYQKDQVLEFKDQLILPKQIIRLSNEGVLEYKPIQETTVNEVVDEKKIDNKKNQGNTKVNTINS